MTFKADRNNVNIICTSLFLFSLILYVLPFSVGVLIFTLIFLLVVISFAILKSRLSEIIIDAQNRKLRLLHSNHFGMVRHFEYDLEYVEFAYKIQATSLRGGVKDVCILFFSGKEITKLIPDQSGWDDSEISRFVYALIGVGVTKKFTGYSLKDVLLK